MKYKRFNGTNMSSEDVTYLKEHLRKFGRDEDEVLINLNEQELELVEKFASGFIQYHGLDRNDIVVNDNLEGVKSTLMMMIAYGLLIVNEQSDPTRLLAENESEQVILPDYMEEKLKDLLHPDTPDLQT